MSSQSVFLAPATFHSPIRVPSVEIAKSVSSLPESLCDHITSVLHFESAMLMLSVRFFDLMRPTTTGPAYGDVAIGSTGFEDTNPHDEAKMQEMTKLQILAIVFFDIITT